MSVFIIEHVYKKFVVDKKDIITLNDSNQLIRTFSGTLSNNAIITISY